MSAEPYTYDFTVHSRDTGLRSTCWMNDEPLFQAYVHEWRQFMPPSD